MLVGKKICLRPTAEQIIQFNKSCGVARWAYNYFLSEKERVYSEWLKNGKQGQRDIKGAEVRKHINNVLKPTTHTWLADVGSNVMKQAIKDAEDAYKRYFQGIAEKPSFKKKGKSKQSFYVNYESLTWRPHGFQGERLGYVKTVEQLPRLPKGCKYSNPRISFDGKYWYLSFSYEVDPVEIETTGEIKGIDLGVKALATCSDGKVYANVNKTKEVKRLKKKLKREQRKLSRKLRVNTASVTSAGKSVYARPLQECKNIQKQKQSIRLLYRQLSNIRNNYTHQVTTEIVKTKPSRIVLEDLNVSGMLKNRHLSEAIAEQQFYEFRRQIEYKAGMRGISVVFVPRFYPSSKLCSCCGHKKQDLKLSDRTYICEHCGLVMDRDLNAARNLAKYEGK